MWGKIGVISPSLKFVTEKKKARCYGLCMAGATGFEPATYGFGDRPFNERNPLRGKGLLGCYTVMSVSIPCDSPPSKRERSRPATAWVYRSVTVTELCPIASLTVRMSPR